MLSRRFVSPSFFVSASLPSPLPPPKSKLTFRNLTPVLSSLARTKRTSVPMRPTLSPTLKRSGRSRSVRLSSLLATGTSLLPWLLPLLLLLQLVRHPFPRGVPNLSRESAFPLLFSNSRPKPLQPFSLPKFHYFHRFGRFGLHSSFCQQGVSASFRRFLFPLLDLGLKTSSIPLPFFLFRSVASAAAATTAASTTVPNLGIQGYYEAIGFVPRPLVRSESPN